MPNIKTNRANFGEKYMDEEEMLYQEDLMIEYLESVIGLYVILYRVDLVHSNAEDIYNESNKNNTTYHPPIELCVNYNIAPASNQTYNQENTTARYKLIGNLTFNIFQSQLDGADCDISVGDVIAVPTTASEFDLFEVTDDGRANIDNLHSNMGYRKRVRSIVATPLDPSKFDLG